MVQNAVTGREESSTLDGSTGVRPGGAHRATFDYNFSRDGGLVDTQLLRGPVLPRNAIIKDAYIDVNEVLTSGGGATVAIGFLTTTDLHSAAAISGAPWSSTGQKDADNGPEPGTESGYIKLTSALGLQMTIASAALTAGRFHVVVEYDVSEE